MFTEIAFIGTDNAEAYADIDVDTGYVLDVYCYKGGQLTEELSDHVWKVGENSMFVHTNRPIEAVYFLRKEWLLAGKDAIEMDRVFDKMTPWSRHHEHIRTWAVGDYRLELYDTNQLYNNRYRLAYQFFHSDNLVFEDDDFLCPLCSSVDGDETVASLLNILSFEAWENEDQLAFVTVHGEELGNLAHELRNS